MKSECHLKLWSQIHNFVALLHKQMIKIAIFPMAINHKTANKNSISFLGLFCMRPYVLTLMLFIQIQTHRYTRGKINANT